MAKSYFSHDSNAKDDPKIILLIDQLGLEGYGAFWILIELLREQPNFRLPVAAIPRISRTYNITQAKLKSVIDCYNLFIQDDEYFFSKSLMCRMGEMSEKYTKRTVKGWETRKQLPDNQQSNVADAMLSNAKNANKIKEKEIKGNKIKVYKEIIPEMIDVRKYFDDNFYSQESADKFFKYYDTANWHDSKGNKVKNWKQKAQAVWFKEENLKAIEVKSKTMLPQQNNTWS